MFASRLRFTEKKKMCRTFILYGQRKKNLHHVYALHKKKTKKTEKTSLLKIPEEPFWANSEEISGEELECILPTKKIAVELGCRKYLPFGISAHQITVRVSPISAEIFSVIFD